MYTLDNGVALNQEFPNSFFLPSQEQKQNLHIGDTVKLIFRENPFVERMWVVITQIDIKKNCPTVYVGTLDNSPYDLETIKLGDTVHFAMDNIIDIFEPENQSQ